MKHFKILLSVFAIAFLFVRCETEDVEPIDDPVVTAEDYYEIKDKAFGEYLIYNGGLQESDDNKLPYGIAVLKDGKLLLNKKEAKKVDFLYLVKDSKRRKRLKDAGVATADDKIANLDGIQFFENVRTIKLTSNGLVGKLDVSMLSKLDTLEMNSNYVNRLIVPTSIMRLRYSASKSSSAPDNRWLNSIDLSKHSKLEHIHLPNHKITKSGLVLPNNTDKLVYVNVSGNTDAPFEVPEKLFNQLETKEGLAKATSDTSGEKLYEIKDTAFGDYLIYNTGLADGEENKLPTGTAFLKDGKRMIDKEKAATAELLYLVKDSKRRAKLKEAGVATADDKITNLDGVQFFTNIRTIKLTSNGLTGKLDVSMLSKLDTLEMNSNYVNELIVPESLTRLRYSASTSSSAPDNRWLTSIDLSKNVNITHIYLKRHKITAAGFKLPSTASKLEYIDVSENVNVPFEIPAELYSQLTTKKGVKAAGDGGTAYTGPTPKEDYFEIPSAAFGEYLVFLTEKTPDTERKLPSGTALKHTDGKFYIKKSIAATAKILYVSKSGSNIKKLKAAGVPTAEEKMTDLEGLQFFTGLTELTATSNAFTTPLKLTKLTKLEKLVVRTAGLSTLDISKNVNLKELDIKGSSKSELGRLKAVSLKTNTKLEKVNLESNEINPKDFELPTSYPNLKSLNMRRNKVDGAEVTYTVPAALYNQLGTGKYDKAGLVKGQ